MTPYSPSCVSSCLSTAEPRLSVSKSVFVFLFYSFFIFLTDTVFVYYCRMRILSPPCHRRRRVCVCTRISLRVRSSSSLFWNLFRSNKLLVFATTIFFRIKSPENISDFLRRGFFPLKSFGSGKFLLKICRRCDVLPCPYIRVDCKAWTKKRWNENSYSNSSSSANWLEVGRA